MDFRSMGCRTLGGRKLGCGTRNRRAPALLLLLPVVALLALSGCVGKSTANSDTGGVQEVTLTPTTTTSLEAGKTQNFSATAKDSAGRAVFTTIHFVSDNNASLTVANNGQACAGTWDSLSVPVRCNPGVDGIAHVTAEAAGVSSPTVTIYVHQHIQHIEVTPVGDPSDPCFSQGTIWNFQATAFAANNADITNSVGPINWSFTTANVLTIETLTDPKNQVQVTAKTPGITQLFANASGTTSNSFRYTTCLVKSIMLQVQGGSEQSTILTAGGTKSLVATAVDTLGVELSKPPLIWSTSNPEVATVSSAGVVTARQNAGAADISASCTPPTCNIGVLPGLPLYSTGGKLPNGQTGFGVIVANVSQAKTPVATAWAATTDCADNFNCTSVMFPVTAGTSPVGTAIGVPFTPNSMRFTPAGGRIYLGSDKGLMFADVATAAGSVSTVSAATTPCNVAVCGTVLAISADSNRVVVSDTKTIPNQVYIFDSSRATSPPVNLLIEGATAAAFSPDQMKIFILGVAKDGSGNLHNTLSVVSTVDALQTAAISLPVAPGSFLPATDLAFSADGSFSYIAGASQPTQTAANFVSAYSTCAPILSGAAQDFGFVATPDIPRRIVPLPGVSQTQDLEHPVITQTVLALEPPNMQLLSAQFTRDPIDKDQFTCNAPAFYTHLPTFTGFTNGPSFNLGQGEFTPLLMQVTGDGTRVVVVAKNIPAVLIVDISSGTTTAIPLANNADPRAASATQDGSQVFVGACDEDHANPNTCGSVHIVNLESGGDLQQAVYTNPTTNDNLCNNLPSKSCLPDLIAVRPQ